MLQQTQASTVTPFFYRWMEKFPHLNDLAKAPFQEIVKEWEGLGYYSRARNLHETAKIIVDKHKGIFPSTEEELQKLPGVGSYTVGAILSFAFKQLSPALDINVLRVLSRLFASSHKISNKTHYKNLLLTILPTEKPWVVMEGLIELGAQICKKKPLCQKCPVQKECSAYRENKTSLFPITTPKPKTIFLKRDVFIILYKNELLLHLETKPKVMRWLYQFPYDTISPEEIKPLLSNKKEELPPIQHTFTKYRVTLFPSIYITEYKQPIAGFSWKTLDELQYLPFSAGHKQITQILLKKFEYMLLINKFLL